MSIQKEFNFNINIDSIIKEEFSFIKGDSVKFTFAFKKADGSDFDDSEATKMRVQAWTKGFSTKSYAFGAEFEKAEDGEWVATFSSNNTVGYAGTLDITVQLIGETDSAIIGAMLIANVIESNSSVSFEASESFRDEIEALALQAIEDAATATAAATEAETAKTGAVEAKTAAEQALSDTQAVKTDVETLKTETSVIKTAAETSLNNIVSTATTSLNAIKTDTEAIKTETSEIKTAAETSLNGIVADAESDLNEIKTDTEALKNATLVAADSATQVVGLQALAQNSAKQGKFYINAGAMYATVDLLGTYFESFSICATIDSSYTGTIFSYGDTSSYFMAQVSSSSIVISSSANGDLISYDCSELTSENRALVFASDGTTLTLYINGLAVATATLNSDVPSGDNVLRFGSYANTSYFPYAYGIMWNVKVFNFDLNCNNTLYTVENYASGDLQKTLLNQSLICGSDSALGSTSGTWNIAYTTQSAGRGVYTIGKWKNGGYAVWLKNLNEEELKQDGVPFATAGVSVACSVAADDSTGSQMMYTEEHSYKKGDLLRIKFKLRKNVLDGYSYNDYPLYYLYIGVNKSSQFDEEAYVKTIYTTPYINQWGQVDFYVIIPRDSSSIQIFGKSPLPIYNDDGEIIASMSYFIADFEIERLGSKLDLMDFSVAENDSTRQVKDGSINQKDMTITGNLSGDKDQAMDNYQSYIITQAIQELNLTSE